MKTETFSSDELDMNKIIVILYALIIVVILSWYAFNSSPNIQEVAKTYWVLMLVAIVIMLAFLIISKFEMIKDIDIPAPILWEKNNFFDDVPAFKSIMSVAVIFAAVGLFFVVGSNPTYQLSGIPSYSFVPDDVQQILLVGVSTAAEDFFAWVALPLLLMTGFMLALKKFGVQNTVTIAIILTCIVNPFLWSFFHISRYGADAVSMQSTFIFGLIMTVYTLTTKNIFLPLLLHPANNLGRTVFQMYSIGNSMGIMWAIMIILVVIVVLWFWSKKVKGRFK